MNPSPVRWPAEWEPHAATWIAWPHNEEDWPERYGPIPWVFGEIVRHLSKFERVRILVNEFNEQSAREVLRRIGVGEERVFLRQAITDRVWTRDFLPTFVKQGVAGAEVQQRVAGAEVLRSPGSDPPGLRSTLAPATQDAAAIQSTVAVKWHFNGWAKYPNWRNDDRAGRMISQSVQTPGFVPFDDLHEIKMETPTWQGQPLVLEGGAIDGNGAGTLLTTEECLQSADVQCRNPGLGKEEYETIFDRYLGVRKTLWLKRGITGDDTHGHIDDLARFVNRHTVVAVSEEDRGDANYDPLRENLELLRGSTTADGEPLNVVTLPMPSPLFCDGQRLPASYANFYMANGLVLVPTFNDANDRRALNTIADLFPDRQVVGVYCGDLVWGFGTIHCMTQQQPA
jgi:agmatine deiminase